LQSVSPSGREDFVREKDPTVEFDEIFIVANQDTAAGTELFALALHAGAHGRIVAR
jgi:hypothetical protein